MHTQSNLQPIRSTTDSICAASTISGESKQERQEPMCFYPTQHQENKRDAEFNSEEITGNSLGYRGHQAHAPTMLYNACANAREQVTPVLLTIVILKCHEPGQHLCTTCRSGSSITSRTAGALAIDTGTGDRGAGIVVAQTSRLYKLHGKGEAKVQVLAGNHRAGDESHK